MMINKQRHYQDLLDDRKSVKHLLIGSLTCLLSCESCEAQRELTSNLNDEIKSFFLQYFERSVYFPKYLCYICWRFIAFVTLSIGCRVDNVFISRIICRSNMRLLNLKPECLRLSTKLSVPIKPQPEEAQKWSESFSALIASKCE